MQLPSTVRATLEQHQQQHLVRFWDELDPSDRRRLLTQIEEIDFPLIARLIGQRTTAGETGTDSAASRASRALPPRQTLRLPATDADRAAWRTAAARGDTLLSEGKVAAILVAGGQGTRLGFDLPKGMFPLGPISRRTLFQMHCEQLLARGRRAGRAIPYFIMTSDATHADTVEFFAAHDNFGLASSDVYFFQQGTLPAVSDSAARILLADRGRISTSPDGHGGLLKALDRAGLLQEMQDRGIEQLYYHQVDNPTALLCDPALIGHHVAQGSELTTKVVAKESAAEKMGVLVSVDGRTEIIEYSDLPPDRAAATDDDGGLLLWAGNTAIHVFDRGFLQRLVREGIEIPYHIAHKPVPHIDDFGAPVTPAANNAHKFEQFIFDALPFARTALVVEADRACEFNPVKNASGTDSPDTARAALVRLARESLRAAGGTLAEDVLVEISPLLALDEEELARRVTAQAVFDRPTFLQ